MALNIAVASGKGGTGKTTVASCLALIAPRPVQFLDCDVEEPNARFFLKPEITTTETVYLEVPEVDNSKCSYCGRCADICMYNALAVTGTEVLIFPELCHSCGGCWNLCPEQALFTVPKEIGTVNSGRARNLDFTEGVLQVGTATSPPVIKAVKNKLSRDKLSILDAPPGTSCPVVETISGTDFVLLVTEPTAMGLNDLTLAVELVKTMDIPCGVVINRYTGLYNKIEKFCAEKNISVLMKIPLDRDIAEAYAKGIVPVEIMPELREQFTGILKHIEGVTACARTGYH